MRTPDMCPRRPVALPASPREAKEPGVERTGLSRAPRAKTPVLGRLQRKETPDGWAVPGDHPASLGHQQNARGPPPGQLILPSS